MLKNLRLKLTLLYLLVAAALVVLVGAGSYALLYYYFQSTNDLALRSKMAMTFSSLGVEPPDELLEAEQSWLVRSSKPVPLISNGDESEVSPDGDEGEGQTDEDKDHEDGKTEDKNNGKQAAPVKENYEGELSSIFVYPLDETGQLVLNPNPFTPPMPPNLAAANAALQNGSDLRTVRLADGTPVRLLTYRLPPQTGFAIIQLGKPFGDQVNVMYQFMGGLLLLGVVSVLILGIGSWWMAGQSLIPTQQAWEMQQAFVANASHELRTPLTLIRASSEMALRRAADNPTQRELLADVMGECDHMTQLIEDLLLLSRLDAKQLKLERQVIALPDLGAELQRQFERLTGQKNIQLRATTFNGTVFGDRTRLRQILLILLDNALRHTPAGGQIEIAAAQQGRWVNLSVTDSGEGIAAQHLPHIFERFYQAPQSQNSEQRGNGLGLAIAKSLVEAQEGRITLRSEPGKGTCVTFTLPGAH